MMTPARRDGVARASGVYLTNPSVDEGGQKSPAVRVDDAPPFAAAAAGRGVVTAAVSAKRDLRLTTNSSGLLFLESSTTKSFSLSLYCDDDCNADIFWWWLRGCEYNNLQLAIIC